MAKRLVDLLKQDPRISKVVYLSTDDQEAVMSAGDGFDPVAWKDARKNVLARAVELRAEGSGVIVVDDTFHLKSMRKQFRPDLILFLDVPISTCIERNARRTRPVPVAVIEKCFESFERPPCKDSWEDRIPCVSELPTVDFILGLPVSVPVSVEEQQSSAKHALDLALRKVISMKGTPETYQTLNQKRRALLSTWKEGDEATILESFTLDCMHFS